MHKDELEKDSVVVLVLVSYVYRRSWIEVVV